MIEIKEEKISLLDTPIPVSILYPFKKIYHSIIGEKEIKPLPNKVLRIIFAGLIILFFAAIYLMEGISNPIELLVDIPLFSFDGFPEGYETYYFVFIPFFILVFSKIIEHFICRGEHYPVVSVNGILLWIVNLLMGIFVDSLTRNVFLERFFIPFYDASRGDEFSFENRILLIFLLSFTLFAFYYILNDSMQFSLSVFITPYILYGFDLLMIKTDIEVNMLLFYLIVTVVLKLILSIAEKFGLISFITNLIGKYCFTPRHLPKFYLFVFLGVLIGWIVVPFLPFIIPIYLIKKRKEK